jgi:diamine N-acetyltransferase
MLPVSVELRKCGPADLDLLREIGCQTFAETFGPQNTAEDLQAYLKSAFDPARLAAELGHPHSAFYLLYVDGFPAGYLKLNELDAQNDLMDPALLEIERIYVRASFQGRGLGRRLIEQALEVARERGKRAVWLGVWDQNFAAIEFYKKMGFAVTGTHPFVLGGDVQTDFMMTRELDGDQVGQVSK